MKWSWLKVHLSTVNAPLASIPCYGNPRRSKGVKALPRCAGLSGVPRGVPTVADRPDSLRTLSGLLTKRDLTLGSPHYSTISSFTDEGVLVFPQSLIIRLPVLPEPQDAPGGQCIALRVLARTDGACLPWSNQQRKLG